MYTLNTEQGPNSHTFKFLVNTKKDIYSVRWSRLVKNLIKCFCLKKIFYHAVRIAWSVNVFAYTTWRVWTCNTQLLRANANTPLIRVASLLSFFTSQDRSRLGSEAKRTSGVGMWWYRKALQSSCNSRTACFGLQLKPADNSGSKNIATNWQLNVFSVCI